MSTEYETNKDYLDYLFWVGPYQDRILRTMIDALTKNCAKEIAKDLANLIISYFQLLEGFGLEDLKDCKIEFVKTNKKEVKRIGFDPNQELAKQLELRIEPISNKKILLIDLLYSDKMQEYAKDIEKEVWGVVIARE